MIIYESKKDNKVLVVYFDNPGIVTELIERV